jgi:ParB-like chromosome segregation protein Spo0J
MANQLKIAIVQSILLLHAQGWSRRAIARRLGVHRETVSRHLRRAVVGSKPAKMPAGPGPAADGLAAELFSPSPEPRAGEGPPSAVVVSPVAGVVRRRYCDR